MNKTTPQATDRRVSEQGAAMVIVLLIASIMLVAVVGVMLQVSMNAANVSDINAEQQAYNAAESGLQTTLNVLRRNTKPNPLIDDTKADDHPENRISYAKAVRLSTSNHPNDPAAIPRLSRWMNYDYTPTGATFGERVTLGSAIYDPLTGGAFDVEVYDPDNPQKIISLDITGDIDGGGNSKTFGAGPSTATIQYNSSTHAGVDVSIREANIDLGNFTITTQGLGAFVPADTRFSIKVRMTAPFKATKIIRGTIKAGYIGPNNIHDVKFEFDSTVYVIMGSVVTLSNPITPNPPSVNGGRTDINVTVTLSEPIRLRIVANGYGPRGARKTIEAIVQKNFFNGLPVPATLSLIGKSSGFVFNPGTSNRVTYSGNDVASIAKIPPVGTTNNQNLQTVVSSVLCRTNCNANIIGNPANISEEIPDWLSTPEKLDTTLEKLKTVARASGSYHTDSSTASSFGNNTDATGITFIDDDLEFSGLGGGILVCTGKLTFRGGFDFNGLIIVTGKDGILRSGGGEGVLQGNVVVAPYLKNDLSAGFQSPKYDISGGGKSLMVYNSSSFANGLYAVSNIVLGIVEK